MSTNVKPTISFQFRVWTLVIVAGCRGLQSCIPLWQDDECIIRNSHHCHKHFFEGLLIMMHATIMKVPASITCTCSWQKIFLSTEVCFMIKFRYSHLENTAHLLHLSASSSCTTEYNTEQLMLDQDSTCSVFLPFVTIDTCVCFLCALIPWVFCFPFFVYFCFLGFFACLLLHVCLLILSP